MTPEGEDRGWIVDASVALKWFLPVEREPEGESARAAIGRIAMRTTTLALYEVGNILVRGSGWSAAEVGVALDLLLEICGDPLALTREDHIATAKLAREHGLTFYDASYAAIAKRMGRTLVSADQDLLEPGLAVTIGESL